MESFIPYCLNKASREKDFKKIKTMGPYATAIGVIIGWAQESRCNGHRDHAHNIYRGLGYSSKQIQTFRDAKNEGTDINLLGFLSFT